MEAMIAATYKYVRIYMEKYDSSHDFSHIQRVLALARQIAKAEHRSTDRALFDQNIITLASLLHDVGDKKYLSPGEDGSVMVLDFLTRVGADAELAQKVRTIVNHVSYSSEIKEPAAVQRAIVRYPELAVVQDADRLDAIGAVGIGRCFTFSAGRVRQGSMEDAIRHFGEKLVRLEGMMKTETGRRLARARTERIVTFQKWWQEEAEAMTLGE